MTFWENGTIDIAYIMNKSGRRPQIEHTPHLRGAPLLINLVCARIFESEICLSVFFQNTMSNLSEYTVLYSISKKSFFLQNIHCVKQMLAESSENESKAVLYDGIELVEKVLDVPSLTDGRKSIPILMLPTNPLWERNFG